MSPSNPFLEDLGDEFDRNKFFKDIFPIRHRRGSEGGSKVYNFPVIINSVPPTIEVPFQILIGGTPTSTSVAFAIGGWTNKTANEQFTPGTNAWATKAVLTTGRGGLSSAKIGTTPLGVVCGGDNNSSTLATNAAYTPSTNIWVNKTAIPTPVAWAAGPQAPAITEALFMMTGWQRTNTHLQTNYEYSLTDDVWSVRTQCLSQRRRMGAMSFAEDVHIVSGEIGGVAEYNHHYKYIPSSSTWSTETASTYSGEHAGTSSGTKGYIFQAYSQEWDNVVGIWTVKTSFSDTPIRCSAFTSYSKIYTVGDDPNGQDCLEYDPVTNGWLKKTNMPTGREWLTSFSFESLSNELIFFKINDYTDVEAAKKFMSLQRRGIELFSIDTTGKFSGQNSAIPQDMVAVDLIELAQLSSLSATSGLKENLNRIRYKIGSLMGYPGSWFTGTSNFSGFVTLVGSQHVSGVKEIGTIYVGEFNDYTGSVRIFSGDIRLKKGARIFFDA